MKDIKSIKLFLFDMDGTLYLGKKLFPFTKELLDTIRTQGKKYIFMTNNSSRSVDAYVKRMNDFGIPSTREDFVTSGEVTAMYLCEHFSGKVIYGSGTASFISELREYGLNIVTEFEEGMHLDAVCIGFDSELTFKKLENLSKILCNYKDIPYVAANPDLCCPMEYGAVPDCGSLAIALYNATGREPYFIGKPRPEMPLYAVKRAGIEKDDAIAVGDRLNTDVACGVNAGIHSLLVLSGESTLETVEKSDVKPEFIMKDCGELLDILKS